MVAASIDLSDFATVEVIAGELGMSPWTLREKCRRGEWPHRKPPGCRRILVSRAETAAFLEGGMLTSRRLSNGGRAVTVRGRSS